MDKEEASSIRELEPENVKVTDPHAHIFALLCAIEEWAGMEDGIPEEVAPSYEAAKAHLADQGIIYG